MSRRLNKDDIEHFIDNDLYIPTRTLYIGTSDLDGDDTNALMAERVIKNLHILDSKSADPIEIVMMNNGGDYQAGLAVYDAIQLCRSPITMKIFGGAMSMGAFILQAADERLLSPNATIMIHYGYEGYDFNHPKIIRNWREAAEKDFKLMKEVLLKKIREKHPAFTSQKIDHMLDFDTILSAQEAVDLGLADGILQVGAHTSE